MDLSRKKESAIFRVSEFLFSFFFLSEVSNIGEKKWFFPLEQ